MVAPAAPKKPAARKRAPARRKAATATDPAESGLVDQMRAMAGRVLDMGAATVGAAAGLHAASEVARALRDGRTLDAAGEVLRALLPGLADPAILGKTGAALRRLRKAAGLTATEVGAAINLKDPSLIEAWENGRIAVPFELILRLAAVLGRNDPVGFVMKFTRSSNPDLWRSLEGLGIGKLLIQSAREREFANIYRGDDKARQLTDQEFAAVLTFTRAAFAMAMAFHGRGAQQAKDRQRTAAVNQTGNRQGTS